MLRPARSFLAALALVSVLAACSATAAAPNGVATLESAGPSADASAAPSASLDPEAAQLAFAQCMREHGVDMPDPQTGPNGGFGFMVGGGEGGDGDGGELEAAMEACDHFLQDAVGERMELDPELLDRMVDFAACMREHGIDMPDPQADGGRITIRGNLDSGEGNTDGGPRAGGDVMGIDPSSPEFQEAQEACRPILGDSFNGPQVQGGSEPAKP